MRHAGRLVAATTLLLSIAACSVLVDTSGLATDVTATSDASPSAVEAASDSPSGGDGMTTPTDGAVPAEPGDAGVDAADSSPPACTPSATTICDDFDEPTPPAAGWTKGLDRGSVTFGAVGLSLPNAFEATIVAGSGTGDAYLSSKYSSVRTNVRCDFDMKLIDVPNAHEIDVIDFITPVTGAYDYHVYVGRFDGVWSAAEYQTAPDGGTGVDRTADLVTTPPSNSWFHVVFEQSGTSATLTANGSTITLDALTLPSGGTGTSVNIGITYAAAEVQSTDVIIDNVACTVLP